MKLFSFLICSSSDGESASGGSSFAVAGGRIYSEIIRIWDIVFDHDNLARTIETVVKSYDRGKDCIIQKKLVGDGKMKFTPGKIIMKKWEGSQNLESRLYL